MKGKVKKVKDALGNYIYPVTRAEAVHVDDNGKTLAQKLTEIGTSGSSATLPTGPVDPRNIGYVEVVSEQTANIFDKRTITTNGYYDTGGVWVKDTSYVSSAPIPVTAGQTYTSKNAVLATFWTSAGVYNGIVRTKSFTPPANSAYVRLCLTVANVESELFVKGSTLPTTYEAYGETPVYKLPNKTFAAEPPIAGVKPEHFSSAVQTYIDSRVTEDDRLEKARGKVNLFVETSFEGYNQPIHPKVIAFASAWNGYKYWMASTPYPYALDNTENPHIHASNDMLYWEVPTGLTNPIDDLTDGTQTYWSDTHLVYRPDLNRLECWYRGVVNSTGIVTIARKTSTDGKTWSAREVLYTIAGSGFVSHAVVWDAANSKYKVWTFGSGQGVFDVSADGLTWTKIGTVKYDTLGVTMPIWHADVEKTDVGYEMVVQPDTNNCATIDHYVSDDGITWRDKKNLMKKSDVGIDAGGFYRACLLKLNGIYYVFTSTISATGERGITLSIASKPNDIKSLKGIDASHIQYMNAPSRKPKGGRKGQIVFDQALNKAIICTTGGRYAVWKDFNGTIV